MGREAEVRALEATSAKVVIVSGIGGQGKSTLAAHYLRLVSEGATQFTQWDWRDCKEEGDRIRTQLLAAIERMSSDNFMYEKLGSAPDADIVDTFVRLSEKTRTVFVLDNVDGYVDLVDEVFVGILDRLVREFARSATRSRIIITCRPRARYDLISVITIPLSGLSLEETTELFGQRVGVGKTSLSELAEVHASTEGHAFWLDMIAVQVGRVPGVTLASMIDEIRRGRGGPTGLLSSIWKTLVEREKVVLRAMAETMRPESQDLIAEVVSGKLNFKNFQRALRSLVNLNLVLVKTERNSADVFDLHPLVRQFVRATFARPDRVGFIKIVLVQYSNIINGIGAALGVHLPFSMLERWSQKAELEIEAGLLSEALATLAAAENALVGAGYTEEFVRVARKLFQKSNWPTLSSLPQFDGVWAAMIDGMSDLEEFDDADDMLRQYGTTVSAKTARYINYCDVRAYHLWKRQQFEEAIEWATKGDDLKRDTHVDTPYDCAHTLALARRDGGDPQAALEYFLGNENLEKVIDRNDASIDNAPLLGNVGRCLQFMGRLDDSLVCFMKSAKMLETAGTSDRLSNQGYARQWIGEVLEKKGLDRAALLFFRDAEVLLSRAFPGRAREMRQAIDKLGKKLDLANDDASDARRVARWIQKGADAATISADLG
nr:NB-ARC domain-containing protein [Rhizobium phaseoli]